jgi:hypothetical protein
MVEFLMEKLIIQKESQSERPGKAEQSIPLLSE